jgi:arginine utilization protein RocB
MRRALYGEALRLAERTERRALELTAIPSVTGSADESAFAGRLHDLLLQLPAFAELPGNVWTIPVAGDPLGRASVAALVRGSGAATVVLTGHYDTVRVDDYGDLADLAMRPHELKPALIQRLGDAGATLAEKRALADLENGEFLPGRGLLDMKSGLAAGIAVLEAFAAEPGRAGNVLFLAVPDEEASSAGARSVAQALPDIGARHGLELKAAINLDSLVDEGDGSGGRAIALGTVGKLLPSALVVGQAVHASNSSRGLNAGVLAAAIVAEVEWAETLAEATGAERAAPPTLLGMKDNRTSYDVTTPDKVWAYWNVMTHRQSPEEVLTRFGALCQRGVERAVATLAVRSPDADIPDAVPIVTFGELRAELAGREPAAASAFAAHAESVAARGLDLPEQCRILSEHLWNASGRAAPAVMIGFASLPYLPTALSGGDGRRLEAAVRKAAADAAAGVSLIRYFPGISDMSFLGQADADAIPFIAANTPAWGFGIPWPARNAIGGVPIVNAGPWGRDYHTPLERLHTPYAFQVLPTLLRRIVREVLSG